MSVLVPSPEDPFASHGSGEQPPFSNADTMKQAPSLLTPQRSCEWQTTAPGRKEQPVIRPLPHKLERSHRGREALRKLLSAYCEDAGVSSLPHGIKLRHVSYVDPLCGDSGKNDWSAPESTRKTKRLMLVRHAHTDHNVFESLGYPKGLPPYKMWKDGTLIDLDLDVKEDREWFSENTELTPKGQKQAAALRDHIPKGAFILTSGKPRTLATAAIATGATEVTFLDDGKTLGYMSYPDGEKSGFLRLPEMDEGYKEGNYYDDDRVIVDTALTLGAMGVNNIVAFSHARRLRNFANLRLKPLVESQLGSPPASLQGIFNGDQWDNCAYMDITADISDWIHQRRKDYGPDPSQWPVGFASDVKDRLTSGFGDYVDGLIANRNVDACQKIARKASTNSTESTDRPNCNEAKQETENDKTTAEQISSRNDTTTTGSVVLAVDSTIPDPGSSSLAGDTQVSRPGNTLDVSLKSNLATAPRCTLDSSTLAKAEKAMNPHDPAWILQQWLRRKQYSTVVSAIPNPSSVAIDTNSDTREVSAPAATSGQVNTSRVVAAKRATNADWRAQILQKWLEGTQGTTMPGENCCTNNSMSESSL